MRPYAEAGLLHAFDVIIGSDVVYDHYHGQLAHVVLATLKRPAAAAGSAPGTAAAAGVPGTVAASDDDGAPSGAAPGATAALDAGACTPPWAVFCLPDSRPRLREFVQGLADAGLRCRVERVAPRCQMLRRLRASRDDWGAGGASFSLYFVTHMPTPGTC